MVELGNLSQPTKENPVHFEPLMQPLRSNIRAFDSESGSQVAVDPPKSKAAFHEGTGPTRAKRSGDSRQKSDYDKIRREIHTTSPWYQYREQTKDQASPHVEQKIRAATCEKLENAPSVPHRSTRSIKSSTLLDFVPLWVRRLSSRTPFLLRLVLMPLSYLHPIKIASVSVSASGSWMAGVMQDGVYSVYDEGRDDIKQLEQTISDWMNNASFCVDLTQIRSFVQISARASQDMGIVLRCASSMVMRIEPSTNKVAPAMSLDGADATFNIPVFFLPSHEHLIPPRSSAKTDLERSAAIEKLYGQTDGTSATDHAFTKAVDQSEVGFSAHLSFPAVLDRAMVDFFTDLIESIIVM